MNKTGVVIDNHKVLEHMDDMSRMLSGRDPKIVVFAHKQHEREISKAFSSGLNPETGRRWDRRKHSYPWKPLSRTGNLRASVSSGFGIKTRDGRLKVFGKIRDGYYLGRYTRGGGGDILGAHKPIVVVAGSVLWGRKTGRSVAGMRTRTRKGITRSRLHGGGSKLKTAASSGTTSPRWFFGIGQMAKFRTKRFAQRSIKKVFD